MSKHPFLVDALLRPINIRGVITLKTLADVRKLISHVPEERAFNVAACRENAAGMCRR
jgi:hypothetical protein